MIVERAEHPQFLSNAYLVYDAPGGAGVLIDSNDVTGPLVEKVREDDITITHILLTHHHYDHVVGLAELREAVGNPPVLAHPLTADLIMDPVEGRLSDGDIVDSAGTPIRVLETPGHCADHLALLVGDGDVFTADVLFKGTVGGTRAPGATGFEDLRASIMDKLMALPPETAVHPGHREPTTIGEEWESNPFIRIWRGLDEEAEGSCRVGGTDGEEAQLVLWAPDYDGGNKAWVRFAGGEDAIVGGSQVERLGLQNASAPEGQPPGPSVHYPASCLKHARAMPISLLAAGHRHGHHGSHRPSYQTWPRLAGRGTGRRRSGGPSGPSPPSPFERGRRGLRPLR